MGDKQDAIIYISDDCGSCKALLEQMNKWDVSYEVKNITQNINHMRELQANDIYGTPATFVEERNKFILGFPKNELRQAFDLYNY